ncbi:hypothetical protein BJ742DRAFT_808608 [Cladochytrium replicatum]|nr:hypothetical protein BJ742DRAFT_808608 [Cladochytrium replicatum]
MDISSQRRIVIIGGGISGLATALALKRVARNTGLNIQPIIFERQGPESYHEHAISDKSSPAQFYILWRWVIDLLREMGLGHRLARIARPVVTFKSVDSDTNEQLVTWPPVDALSTTTDPITDNLPMGDPLLPPMVGVRRVDLLRLLMIALTEEGDELIHREARANAEKSSMSGKDNIVDFSAVDGANNADGKEDVEGLEADMARGDWFVREKFLEKIPYLCMGYELVSFIISASSGLVSARFANDHVEVCDMLIGADGINSKVRELIGSDRYPPQHAGAFICHGITRMGLPLPFDAPTELPDGTVIQPLTPEDIRELVSDGASTSTIGRGLSIGIANLGNGNIGWNIVAAQTEEGQHLRDWVEQKRRNAVSKAVLRTSRLTSPTNMTATVSMMETVRLRDEPESDSTGHDGDVADDTMAKLEGRAKIPLPPRDGEALGTQPTAFELQLRAQLAERASQIFDSPHIVSMEIPKHVEGMYYVRGSDARGIALKLITNGVLNVPATVHALIARTDAQSTIAMDVMDMADRWLDSYTSPQFHPGRIMMLGDAAHPVATNAHNGSVGAGLAIADGAVLAGLFAKYFAPVGVGVNGRNGEVAISLGAELSGEASKVQMATLADAEAGGAGQATSPGSLETGGLYAGHVEMGSDDITLFQQLGQEFDSLRTSVCNQVMREARYEGGWDRTENTWFRSLLRLSYKYTPTTWVKASYATRLTRGGVRLPDERLQPFHPGSDIPLSI